MGHSLFCPTVFRSFLFRKVKRDHLWCDGLGRDEVDKLPDSWDQSHTGPRPLQAFSPSRSFTHKRPRRIARDRARRVKTLRVYTYVTFRGDPYVSRGDGVSGCRTSYHRRRRLSKGLLRVSFGSYITGVVNGLSCCYS